MARAIVEVEDKWKITNSCQEAPKRKASDGFVYADSIVTDGLTSEIVVLFQKENHRVTLSKDFSEAKKFLLSDVFQQLCSLETKSCVHHLQWPSYVLSRASLGLPAPGIRPAFLSLHSLLVGL